MAVVLTDLDPVTGISTRVHELETKTVIEKKYDVEPFIETAAEMRRETEGQRWGDMRHVGFIPMAELGKMMRQDGTIDKKRCMDFLRKNPALATFSKVLR